MITLLLILLAADPVTTAWIRGPQGSAKALPDVRSVDVGADYVTVHSSGVSLRYLGPLQAPPLPDETVRQYEYRIPLHPQPGEHSSLPAVAGAFLNGLPIYRQFEGESYRNANIWHYDPILRNQAAPGLIEQLNQPTLIGFALDGYPVYAGGRERSSYRLRHITQRRSWPDGTELTPAQYGPDVTPGDPLGTFAEDYEYVPGSGSLDSFNGRIWNGTYGYFQTASFPYLLAYRYYGKTEQTAPANLSFRFTDADGKPLRLLETVHEKPVHLIVVSEDLQDFAHIHPQLTTRDTYDIQYQFPHAGHYRLYAEITPPGSATRIQSYDMTVDGPKRTMQQEQPNSPAIALLDPGVIRANEDTLLHFALNVPNDQLQLYLGAWAHFAIIDRENQIFIHAHPLEGIPTAGSSVHTHVHTMPMGAAPNTISTVASFPHPGVYKLWAQIQVSGEVITVPFRLNVAEATR